MSQCLPTEGREVPFLIAAEEARHDVDEVLLLAETLAGETVRPGQDARVARLGRREGPDERLPREGQVRGRVRAGVRQRLNDLPNIARHGARFAVIKRFDLGQLIRVLEDEIANAPDEFAAFTWR